MAYSGSHILYPTDWRIEVSSENKILSMAKFWKDGEETVPTKTNEFEDSMHAVIQQKEIHSEIKNTV